MAGQDEIVSKTKELSFTSANISHPFETHGGGGEQTVSSVANHEGKGLQESYRSGFGESAKYTQKVTGR